MSTDDPRLAPADADGDSTRFRCDNCGAAMRWDPEPDALACQHCEHTRLVPRADDLIEERPLSEAGDAARGLDLELRVSACDGCGARVSFDQSATSTSCVYCGSASVLEHAANRNALRPESVIPLDVARATVEAEFTRWLGKLWFRPNALRKARSQNVAGVYVPFFTFDTRAHSEWSADAGYYYYVPVTRTRTVNGKRVTTTSMERRTRWEPAWGDREDLFDDFLMPASGGLSNKLLEELGDFDMRALVPYRAEYLAGWRAEEYALDLADAWSATQLRLAEIQRERCSGDVPGDTQRALRVHNSFSEPHWKHVLLPVWSLNYRHGEKHYRVLVHGQSGHVVGEAPYSWVKIALAVLLGGGAVLLGVLAMQ
ncbi:MAG: hypothetical protein DHS20C15_28910 [Planctomycetota bacterium]|nr:MAG: hypothetical protein DHS20C15_28910 [Planctomycetota bacterium]